MIDRPDHAAELRRELVDVRAVIDSLGLAGKREGAGFKVLCPWHSERTASCTIRLGPDGTLQARCHACGEGGDVLSLIAAVRGLPMPSGFRDVLLEAAHLAGRWDIVDELEGRLASGAHVVRTARPAPPPPPPSLDPEIYATVAESLLELCPLGAQRDACAYLEDRRVFADADARGLRALPPKAGQAPIFDELVRRFGPETIALAGLTNDTGDGFRAAAWRLLIPWRNREGRVLSVQRRVLGPPPGDAPKYLFPRGRPMPAEPFGAERFADDVAAFRTSGAAPSLAFTESALDAIAMAMLVRRHRAVRVVLGIPSASTWRPEWAAYGKGLRVLVATDADSAGEKVAAAMIADLRKAGVLSLARVRPAKGKKDWGDVAT